MSTLNDDLKNKKYKKVYLFCGEEDYLKTHYKKVFIDAISEGDPMNVEEFDGKDVEAVEIMEVASTAPFMAEYRLVIAENTDFFGEKGNRLAKYLEEMPDSTILIFVEESPKASCDLYKAIKKLGSITQFKREGEKNLKSFAKSAFKKSNVKISERDLTYFIDCVGDDMELISREVEKLISYCLDKGEATKDDIDMVCVKQLSVKIFDMMDYMSVKDRQKTLAEFYKLIEDKESPFRILSMISRQFDILLLVKDLVGRGLGKSEIMQQAGLSEFVVRKSIGQCRHFSIKDLLNGFYACVKAEDGFKTGLIADDVLMIELLIMKVTA